MPAADSSDSTLTDKVRLLYSDDAVLGFPQWILVLPMEAAVLLNRSRRTCQTAPLRELLDAVRLYREPIPQNELLALVHGLRISIHDVAEYCHFHPSHYTRNLIERSRHVEVLCMCWLSGQRSAIHDHAESACVVRVLDGVMTNIDYQVLPSGYIVPTASHEHGVGVTEARSDESIHQVANLQSAGCNLVTLHVYSPPLTRMRVFSPDQPHAHWPASALEYGIEGEGI